MLHLLQFFLRWLLTPVFFFLFGTINCQSCALWLFWPSDLLPKRHIFCFVFSVSSDSVSIPFSVWRNFFFFWTLSTKSFFFHCEIFYTDDYSLHRKMKSAIISSMICTPLLLLIFFGPSSKCIIMHQKDREKWRLFSTIIVPSVASRQMFLLEWLFNYWSSLSFFLTFVFIGPCPCEL